MSDTIEVLAGMRSAVDDTLADLRHVKLCSPEQAQRIGRLERRLRPMRRVLSEALDQARSATADTPAPEAPAPQQADRSQQRSRRRR